MTWKSGTFLVLTAGASLIGIKELVTGNEEVVNVAKEESYLNTDNFTGLHEEIESPSGLGTETGSTWEPSPVPVNGTPNYNWGVNYSEEQKAKNREEAKRIYGTLNDYAFRIFMPCARGTGWILDYEIPKDGGYPTKWYIATDLHVIWELRFSEDTYVKELPFWGPYVKNLREKNKSKYEAAMKDTSLLRTSDKCKASREFGYLDINIGQEKTGKELRANEGAIAKKQMKEPKLFYAALDFLDRGVREKYNLSNHFADFGVVEFEFTNPEEARKATNGFATKYENNPHALDVLASPLETKYKDKTPQELKNSWDNYYILAYPDVDGKGDFEAMTNWDEDSTIASHLGGFARSSQLSPWGYWTRKFIWQGTEYKEFGHRYTFRHRPLKAGASGGLYVDGEGKAAGVYVQGGTGSGWVQPLRSAGTTEEREGVNTPEYDLILGAKGQINSYKQQVQKYILNNGAETWLSRRGNWEKNK